MINKILFVLIFIIATSAAQNYSELIIKVFDGENQQPIERVNISIKELNENFLTDKLGKTESIRVLSGNYSVSISHLGYKNLNEKIVISGTGKFEFSFSLETESILMNDVTITSTRGVERESPFTFSNISSKELEKQALIKDIPFVLNNLPSTTIHSENGNGLGY
nr:carboxypeptidase-like regulatory domain-containing protein [Ignavibacteriaceae bacterium]